VPLGTLERTPPPFFRQGPSAATRLVFFTALALFFMVADARFAVVAPFRHALAAVLMPLQHAAALPVGWIRSAGHYLEGLTSAQRGERDARAALAEQAQRAQRADQLERDNLSLRALLELRAGLSVRSVAAEVLYEAADPYSRKIVLGRGSAQGVVSGSPVLHPQGVLGQVTRVYGQIAEVTLLADKDAAIPVLNPRTMQRAIAYGGVPGGLMELRFVSANSDVQVGDALVTSGLDGVYPPGMPVATVQHVDRRAESGFARVALQPAVHPDGVRFVLIVEPTGAQLPARPAPQAQPAPVRGGRDRAGRPGVQASAAAPPVSAPTVVPNALPHSAPKAPAP
jgi:rod shape-determining protein MreC